jgi:carboxymethylenebutenolidase
MSEFIDVATPDGTFRAYCAKPQGAQTAPAVVVLQEIFGINDDLKATCDTLAQEGFAAVCPDLFWRLEPDVSMSKLDEAEWQRGFGFYQRFDRDKGVADIGATLEVARKLPGSSGKVGVMGFCLGGLMTFITAARKSPDAAVEYYGGETEKYIGEASSIRCPTLIHLAEADEYMPGEAQQTIRAGVKSNPKITLYSYPGCKHAFARHHGVHYDATAATQANSRTAEFLNKHLR